MLDNSKLHLSFIRIESLNIHKKIQVQMFVNSPGLASYSRFVFVSRWSTFSVMNVYLFHLIRLKLYFCCFMIMKCICIWSNTFLMVFELSLIPIKFESWYHDFMTEGVSPANKDESGITGRAGWTYKSIVCSQRYTNHNIKMQVN